MSNFIWSCSGVVQAIVEQIESALILYPEGGWVEKGGPGSGHWGHKGRKGKRGGSAPSKGRGIPKGIGSRFVTDVDYQDAWDAAFEVMEDPKLADIYIQQHLDAVDSALSDLPKEDRGLVKKVWIVPEERMGDISGGFHSATGLLALRSGRPNESLIKHEVGHAVENKLPRTRAASTIDYNSLVRLGIRDNPFYSIRETGAFKDLRSEQLFPDAYARWYGGEKDSVIEWTPNIASYLRSR